MSRHTKRWARAGRIGSDRLLEDRGLDRMHVFLTDNYGMGFTAALLSRRRLAGVDDGDLEWFTYLQFVPDLDPEYVKIGKSMDLREQRWNLSPRVLMHEDEHRGLWLLNYLVGGSAVLQGAWFHHYQNRGKLGMDTAVGVVP